MGVDERGGPVFCRVDLDCTYSGPNSNPTTLGTSQSVLIRGGDLISDVLCYIQSPHSQRDFTGLSN